jgi:hypothetical protein
VGKNRSAPGRNDNAAAEMAVQQEEMTVQRGKTMPQPCTTIFPRFFFKKRKASASPSA